MKERPEELIVLLDYLKMSLEGFHALASLSNHGQECQQCALAAFNVMSGMAHLEQFQSMCCDEAQTSYEKISKTKLLVLELPQFLDELEAKYMS